jgi:hypothetical protein
MGKATPGIADKGKWDAKTASAVGQDCARHKGIPVGYAIAFFNPFEPDSEKQWSFAIRLGHSQDYMDDEQRKRLEVSLEYIMAGVQKIFSIGEKKVEEWLQEDKDNLADYIKTARYTDA